MADPAFSVPRYTPEQYQVIERDSSTKHEFVNGVVYAMAGTSNWHNMAALNLIAYLNARLPEHCRALGMDVQLHIKTLTSEDFFYPDAFVSRGELREAREHDDALVVAEVLSPTTEDYDRGAKMLEYCRLGTLQEFVLIKPDGAHAEIYRRRDGWVKHIIQGRETLQLESIGIEVPLAEIYRRIPIALPSTP